MVLGLILVLISVNANISSGGAGLLGFAGVGILFYGLINKEDKNEWRFKSKSTRGFKKNLPEMQVKAVEERLKEYDGLKKKLEESERLEKYYRQTLTEKIMKLKSFIQNVMGYLNLLVYLKKRGAT